MVFITDVQEETKLGPTVVYSALVRFEDVIDDVIHIIEKSLQTHLLKYHPWHVKCLQYDNSTSNIQYERKVH